MSGSCPPLVPSCPRICPAVLWPRWPTLCLLLVLLAPPISLLFGVLLRKNTGHSLWPRPVNLACGCWPPVALFLSSRVPPSCPPLGAKTVYVVIVQSRLCLFCWPRRFVWVCVSCLSTLSALLPQPCLGLVRCLATPLFLNSPPCPGMFSCGYECNRDAVFQI